MNKKGEIPKIGMVIMLVVVAVFGIALFEPIINTQDQMTSLQPIADETFDLVSEGCITDVNGTGQVNESSSNCNLTLAQWTTYDSDWRTRESQCYPSSVVVTNSSGTALTEDTDYTVVASSGLVNMLNTTDTQNATMGNSVLIDYNYCDEGYNKSSSSRSIAGLIGLFTALALVAFIIAYGIREWL